MSAEDLLRDLRREGYSWGAIVKFFRVSLTRVSRGLPEHPELVRPVATTALGLFTIQFGAALVLSAQLERRIGVAYLIASSLLLLFASFWVLTHVGLLHGSPDGQRVVRMPLPVAITMLRLVSIPAIVLLVRMQLWTPVVWLFAASAFTDVLDGVVARAFHLESSVGALLDPLTDILFNSSVFVALSLESVVPWWVTALVLTRYGILAGGTVYLYLFHGPVRIQPTLFGKLTGLLTTLLLGFLLLGLSSWSQPTQHRLKEVFDVGLGVLGLATIIQVVFIGLANRNLTLEPVVEEDRPSKVVGEIRWPRE